MAGGPILDSRRRRMRAMHSLWAATLAEVVVARPFPASIATTCSARVMADDAAITRLDATERCIDQHGLRHMGEIEHARALVGPQGMTSWARPAAVGGTVRDRGFALVPEPHPPADFEIASWAT